MQQAINQNINIINTVVPPIASQQVGVLGSQGTGSSGGTGGGASQADDGKSDKTADKTQSVAAQDSGAKKGTGATKMYCN